MLMWVLFRVPTVYTHITLTTHFVKMCCCGYSKQHPQHHTTTHFAKMCCCGYLKQHPQHHTTTHFVKMCCCGLVGTRNNTHNTIQQHILLKCVVVGTRSNTIQQHTLLMLLLCVTYDDVGVVSSTHNLHPHHFVVVVCHLWWCGCCFEYPQFTPTSL